jgi:hypothetical protein
MSKGGCFRNEENFLTGREWNLAVCHVGWNLSLFEVQAKPIFWTIN